jgi:predicted dehydrogenase
MCFSQQESIRLTQEAASRKLHTQVGHVVRFYPAIQSLYSLVSSGDLGEVFYCESGYWHEIIGAWKARIETGGSALLMGGCHSVDIVRWILGEENQIAEVFAYATPARRRLDFEYPPTVSVQMQYENGSIGKVSTCLESRMPYVFHLQANGTKGSIRNNGFFSDRFPAKGFSRIEADYPDDWEVSHHPFPEEIDYFVQCILDNQQSELSFENARKTYEVIFAAEESLESNRPIRLPLKD